MALALQGDGLGLASRSVLSCITPARISACPSSAQSLCTTLSDRHIEAKPRRQSPLRRIHPASKRTLEEERQPCRPSALGQPAARSRNSFSTVRKPTACVPRHWSPIPPSASCSGIQHDAWPRVGDSRQLGSFSRRSIGSATRGPGVRNRRGYHAQGASSPQSRLRTREQPC